MPDNGDKGASVQIWIAVIGLIGVLGTAVIANSDKIFHSSTNNQPPQQTSGNPADPAPGKPHHKENPGDGGGKVLAGTAQGLSVPVQLRPAPEASFASFPRTTTLVWSPVQGAQSYTAEVDCMGCCVPGAWCTDAGKTWDVHPGISDTSYTFNFVGAQPGRWRVWAVGPDGSVGPKSGWRGFVYTQ